jgi:hypothetical protein
LTIKPPSRHDAGLILCSFPAASALNGTIDEARALMQFTPLEAFAAGLTDA